MASRQIDGYAGRFCLVLAAFLILGSCTGNQPFRTNAATTCHDPQACERTIIEQHPGVNDRPGYDLAFVEFSERGNVFQRRHFDDVLNHVAEATDNGAAEPKKNALVIVFVHGWKNNASHENDNVKSFRKLLRQTAILTKNDNRRVIGVFVGWRGLSLNAGPLSELSYWDRKVVAHQVGKGGVTEFLMSLERIVIDDKDPNRNLFLIAGHSFGGAIVLTALSEVLLERVLEAEVIDKGVSDEDEGCLQGRPFGHGVALLNPAIEANEMLQLKEYVATNCFTSAQDRLMHVISSDADRATNVYFPLGQWFGVTLGWRQTDFERVFTDHNKEEKLVLLKESELDTIAVGNYTPFRTGRLRQAGDSADSWEYASCVERLDCIDADENIPHIPVKNHEPLAFIWTDEAYIGDHNDVFTDNVIAYLAAIVAEARNKLVLAAKGKGRKVELGPGLPEKCRPNAEKAYFEFGDCLAEYQKLFAGIPDEGVAQ